METVRNNITASRKQNNISASETNGVTESFIYKASIASYRSEPASHGSFTLFGNLPVELRVRIWHHAISVPRIVEMEKIPSWRDDCEDGKNMNPPDRWADRWHYKIKNLPPLLSTCSESRQEALKACRYKPITPGNYEKPDHPAWIRFDYDILHLKARTWRDRGGQWCVHRWFDSDIRDSRGCGDGQMSKMRDFFSKIQALAVNSEIFRGILGGLGVEVIRELFPSLKVLFVLIDRHLDVTKIWKFKGQKLVPYYGDDHDPYYRAWAFMAASTGPLHSDCLLQSRFQRSTETWLQRCFEKEEERLQSYAAPKVVVMGCSLPPGVIIPACGSISSRGVDFEREKSASKEATNRPWHERRSVPN